MKPRGRLRPPLSAFKNASAAPRPNLSGMSGSTGTEAPAEPDWCYPRGELAALSRMVVSLGL